MLPSSDLFFEREAVHRNGGDRRAVIVQFRGSCPKCHHRYVIVLFQFSPDPDVHKRMKMRLLRRTHVRLGSLKYPDHPVFHKFRSSENFAILSIILGPSRQTFPPRSAVRCFRESLTRVAEPPSGKVTPQVARQDESSRRSGGQVSVNARI